ncbi:hypothetical protein DM01DRAFT_1333932 [Hesseltinella vesiculosa]|uniref:GYF domain-containing protein n=1 Tax=Hesseltinella vesiculosa TaxID=101127 RepID=A0A1X2GPK2_9FUNG|nr:hypothetical protein DM01DRAFT_1333932 [Hesseltinella vesiculosa]
MSGYKRTKTSFDHIDERKHSKRSRRSPSDSPAGFEDDEDDLDFAKQRRGAVKDVYASDDEEVGFSSESEREEVESDDKAKNNDEDDDMDMFAEQDASTNNHAGGKKNKRLGMDEIEGQDLASRDVESDEDDNEEKTRISAFNMRQELEEGSFDQQGNFIRNAKDPQAHHDQWLQGISKKEMAVAKEAQRKRHEQEESREAQRQAALPQTQADGYLALLDYLLPGESVREALTKMGEGQKKIPLWKQKLLAKKNKNKTPSASEPELSPEEAAQRQRNVEAITEFADQLMALGHYNVYEDTYEQMVRYLRAKEFVEPTWIPASAHRK